MFSSKNKWPLSLIQCVCSSAHRRRPTLLRPRVNKLESPYNLHRKIGLRHVVSILSWQLSARVPIRMQHWPSQLWGKKEQVECRPILLHFQIFSGEITLWNHVRIRIVPGGVYFTRTLGIYFTPHRYQLPQVWFS